MGRRDRRKAGEDDGLLDSGLRCFQAYLNIASRRIHSNDTWIVLRDLLHRSLPASHVFTLYLLSASSHGTALNTQMNIRGLAQNIQGCRTRWAWSVVLHFLFPNRLSTYFLVITDCPVLLGVKGVAH